MRISNPIAIENVPSVPWKNGGGTTKTLVAEPSGAPVDDFLWRISLARVDTSGSFSAFPAVDRTILLWRGEGIVLRSPEWPDQRLTEPLRPFCFRGEDAVTCELLGASAADLNLMVRRGAAEAVMRGHISEIKLAGSWDEVVVLCAAGTTQVSLADGASRTLEADSFLRIAQPGMEISMIPAIAETKFVCVTVRQLR